MSKVFSAPVKCFLASVTSVSMLISMDVNFLCTNIPHEDGVAVCQTILTEHNIQSDIAGDMPILIDFILRHNTFSFND